MITRVWGIVNSEEIEFHRIPDQPYYWEGFAPRVPGLQNIEIWAETDKGARGHLRNQVRMEWDVSTRVRLTITPYTVRLIPSAKEGLVRKYATFLLENESQLPSR